MQSLKCGGAEREGEGGFQNDDQRPRSNDLSLREITSTEGPNNEVSKPLDVHHFEGNIWFLIYNYLYRFLPEKTVVHHFEGNLCFLM